MGDVTAATPSGTVRDSDTNLFVEYLARTRPLIEGRLAELFPAREGAASPIQEDLDAYLFGPLNGFFASGGKRTRPALCLLGAQAVGGRAEQALSAAVAIESFQSAALIHDDIADKGELRRGRPCVHVTEGVGIALNVGDLALATVASSILKDPSIEAQTKLTLLDELVDMTQRTLEGQALDLGWVRDNRWDITVDDYLFMANHKTAYYSAAVPLATGAISAGARPEQVEVLRSFGMKSGLAFQLQDDLLNLVGDAEKQGKDFRSDITEGKRTLIVVSALEKLPASGRDELVGILSSSTGDGAMLARAVELMDGAGAVEETRRRALDLADEAKAYLEGADLLPWARETLYAMADFFVKREG